MAAYHQWHRAGYQVKNRYYFNEDGQLTFLARINDKGKVGSKIPVSILETNPTVFDVLNEYEFIEQAPVTKKANGLTTRKAS